MYARGFESYIDSSYLVQGVEEVIVYCVNDGAVMKAWGDAQKIAGTFVTFVGDPLSDLTKGLDMTLDHPGPRDAGIINRCKRHVFLFDGGKARYAAIAESLDDPAGDWPLTRILT